jgi:hypothetical protein
MGDTATFLCPYCAEQVELWIDTDSPSSLIEDCSICCRPCHISVWWDEDGTPHAHADRSE